ncbi:cyclin family protein [Skeletonema marinoi]|uniref:Cyclin family protein n=1 Tax=Skeletonema marinoi TaxID=267567 RepID=A0AAD8XTC5_9STRA|nr:cyclin family protein [Skeletonema marinoi]
MTGLNMITSNEDSTPSSISRADAADRIAVMLEQESTTYKCRDYLAGDKSTCSMSSSSSSTSLHQPHQHKSQQRGCIDRVCREKMTRWCYQVTDFCKFRRDAVAISISFLDRFLSSSSPRALKALCTTISQGCYDENDILDMEKDILNDLSWRMNGPIVQDFISHLMVFLPLSAYSYDDDVDIILLDIARYQAEIAVCDYDLSLTNHSDIALAALLNSIEGIDEKVFPARSRFEFLLSISDETGLNPFSYDVNVARARLLELFKKNSGYELPQIANLTPVICSKKEFVFQKPKRLNSTGSTSPVSVKKHPYQRKNSQTAKSAAFITQAPPQSGRSSRLQSSPLFEPEKNDDETSNDDFQGFNPFTPGAKMPTKGGFGILSDNERKQPPPSTPGGQISPRQMKMKEITTELLMCISDDESVSELLLSHEEFLLDQLNNVDAVLEPDSVLTPDMTRSQRFQRYGEVMQERIDGARAPAAKKALSALKDFVMSRE